MKVALVHDWLNGMRGGEKVLEILCELFPEAPIYTLLAEPEKLSPTLTRGKTIRTSWIQPFGFLRRHYRYLLPLMPATIERFSLRGYDLVISSSHCVAKGVRVGPQTCHVSYCHTPMRYAWDFQQEYFGNSGFAKRILLEPLLAGLRHWDVASSKRVHHFIANSRFVADRIRQAYGRSAEVIYPPVDTRFFSPAQPASGPEDYFLLVSALVPYKKIEIVLEAFARRRQRLVIVGSGPWEGKLRKLATANVQFAGWVDATALRQYYQRATAVIFPQKEDCGIVPLEAQACGRPVLAYGQGGALETIIGHPDGYRPAAMLEQTAQPTGLFFAEQTAQGLEHALELFDKLQKDFDPAATRANALRFDKNTCREKLRDSILSKVPGTPEPVPTYA